jgi:hypothetical protein
MSHKDISTINTRTKTIRFIFIILAGISEKTGYFKTKTIINNAGINTKK